MLKLKKQDFSHQKAAGGGFHEMKVEDENKLFRRRLVSKETSIANPSFRVYYGDVSGAIPFIWETQPGTPKHKLFSTTTDSLSPPPLTPPPSYFFDQQNPTKKQQQRRYLLKNKSKILDILFFKISYLNHKTKRPQSPISSSLSFSSSTSSSYSSTKSMNPNKGHGQRRNLSMGSLFDDDVFYRPASSSGRTSSKSMLCFRS